MMILENVIQISIKDFGQGWLNSALPIRWQGRVECRDSVVKILEMMILENVIQISIKDFGPRWLDSAVPWGGKEGLGVETQMSRFSRRFQSKILAEMAELCPSHKVTRKGWVSRLRCQDSRDGDSRECDSNFNQRFWQRWLNSALPIRTQEADSDRQSPETSEKSTRKEPSEKVSSALTSDDTDQQQADSRIAEKRRQLCSLLFANLDITNKQTVSIASASASTGTLEASTPNSLFPNRYSPFPPMPRASLEKRVKRKMNQRVHRKKALPLDLAAQCAKLNAQLLRKNSELEALKEDLQKLKAKQDGGTGMRAARKKNLDEEIRLLKKDISALEAQCTTLNDKLLKKNSELEALNLEPEEDDNSSATSIDDGQNQTGESSDESATNDSEDEVEQAAQVDQGQLDLGELEDLSMDEAEPQRGDGVYTDNELDDSENEGEETGPAEAEQFQPEAAIREEGEVACAQRAAGEMGQLDMEFAANVTLRDANEDEALDALNDGPDMIEGAEVNMRRASEVSLSSHTTQEADSSVNNSSFFSAVSRKKDSPEKRHQRAAVVRKFGAAENILVESGIPIPTVGDKQILVQVHSADVNPVDTYIRSGSYAALPSLPYTPGRGGAGIISKIGTNVKKLKVGDRVWFTQAITGSTAQFALTLTELTFPLSKKLSFRQGATLGISYMTAYKALFDKAGAQAGQSVLIHGISDGVGLAAAELARAHGLLVAGTASTQQGAKLAKQKRVMVFNDTHPECNPDIKQKFLKDSSGFDIILEMLPNVNLAKDNDLVANNGRIIVIGNRGSIEISPELLAKEVSVIGVMLGLSTIEDYQRIAERINELIEAGHVSPYVGQHFPLDRIAEAHNAVVAQSNGPLGKIVIDIEHQRE